jgi:hypothetical protein
MEVIRLLVALPIHEQVLLHHHALLVERASGWKSHKHFLLRSVVFRRA